MLPHIQAGKVRALAVAADQRLPQLPDVPTMAEVGHPELNLTSWTGLAAPAATPEALVQALYKTRTPGGHVARHGGQPQGPRSDRAGRDAARCVRKDDGRPHGEVRRSRQTRGHHRRINRSTYPWRAGFERFCSVALRSYASIAMKMRAFGSLLPTMGQSRP